MNVYTFNNPIPPAYAKSLLPTYWANGAALTRLTGKSSGATKEDMLKAAVQIASEASAAKAPLIVLDQQATSVYFTDAATSYAIQAEMVQVIRAECDIPVTSYNANSISLFSKDNRDVELALAESAKDRNAVIAALGQSFTVADPLMNELDYLCVPAYLLGPAWVDRDINFTWAAGKLLKLLYPGKPLIYALWGIYHTSFVPVPTVPAANVLTQYVDAAKGAGDAVIVFDPESPRDDSFIGGLTH